MENSKRKRGLKQHEIQKIVEVEHIKTQMQNREIRLHRDLEQMRIK